MINHSNGYMLSYRPKRNKQSLFTNRNIPTTNLGFRLRRFEALLLVLTSLVFAIASLRYINYLLTVEPKEVTLPRLVTHCAIFEAVAIDHEIVSFYDVPYITPILSSSAQKAASASVFDVIAKEWPLPYTEGTPHNSLERCYLANRGRGCRFVKGQFLCRASARPISKSCYQVLNEKHDGSEDCLSVDLKLPVNAFDLKSSTTKYPIVFYLYGTDGIHTNHYDHPDYRQRLPTVKFVQNMQIILVTVRFRLGMLALPFTWKDTQEITNLALFDIYHAIQWSVHLLEPLHGDRNNVILLGHSYGASLIHGLLTLIRNKRQQSLIRRVWWSSGSVFFPDIGDPTWINAFENYTDSFEWPVDFDCHQSVRMNTSLCLFPQLSESYIYERAQRYFFYPQQNGQSVWLFPRRRLTAREPTMSCFLFSNTEHLSNSPIYGASPSLHLAAQSYHVQASEFEASDGIVESKTDDVFFNNEMDQLLHELFDGILEINEIRKRLHEFKLEIYDRVMPSELYSDLLSLVQVVCPAWKAYRNHVQAVADHRNRQRNSNNAPSSVPQITFVLHETRPHLPLQPFQHHFSQRNQHALDIKQLFGNLLGGRSKPIETILQDEFYYFLGRQRPSEVSDNFLVNTEDYMNLLTNQGVRNLDRKHIYQVICNAMDFSNNSNHIIMAKYN